MPIKQSVDVASEAPGAFRLDVSTDRDALVLVRESWAPGWRATVDHEATPLFPAAGAFFAFEVPAGSHTVDLTYRASGLRLGFVITLAWIAGAVFLGLRARSSD